MRAETSCMQFGDDWRGVFIRGDNAFAYRNSLATLIDEVNKQIEEGQDDPALLLAVRQIDSLYELLVKSDEREGEPEHIQYLKQFDECVVKVVE